ncbi:Hypothetical protein CINCED_3A015394 [Cinara cedri]|uniref:Uncharacterized protein n=1 Tax=Cinara cedri TaxID=506608 RepID=A0A5E4LZI9_9HEMI|nr:Hypothetical protein CINCED_3A015394 [Cinara cedri]
MRYGVSNSRASEGFTASPGCTTIHRSAISATATQFTNHLLGVYAFSHRRVGSPWLFNQYPTELVSAPESNRNTPTTRTTFRKCQKLDMSRHPEATDEARDQSAPETGVRSLPARA